ncbi:MAG: hypothetical protein SOW25_05350, partial [Helicobacter sp.]|nr:hypothetical protein [Helicobacter sp.]
ENLIKNHKDGFCELGEVVEIFKSIELGSSEYKEREIQFARISDLSKFGISKSDIYLNNQKFKNIKKPKKDEILFSKDGVLGIAFCMLEDADFIIK